MPFKALVKIVAVLLGCSLMELAIAQQPADPEPTGPETENRFPPLNVPDKFHATLFACDPLIEYPSVIAVGPTAGSLFVAQDYMTGLGYNSPRPSEIKLVADTDGDGYADSTTLFAGQLNSVQGLAFHNGTVFAMHAPFLTAFSDTNGDGKADERKDLLTGLGLTPKENPNLLHCANGVTVGHDGWLYLALGDRGCIVDRVEGDRLDYRGGGILRCRLDGRDLHLFSTGHRNIYEVALDDELNVFVRDNENDGGDYMIRVYHTFFAADHGYPYFYYERPLEALLPIADLGRGSSAGGVCYLETAFPKELRGNLFYCEWGKSLVRYDLRSLGSGFAPTDEIEFAATAPTDPYGFKPTDVIVDRDGSLLLSDWADGQRPKRGRGRIYRLTYGERAKTQGVAEPAKPSDPSGWLPLLNSDSYFQRCEAQQKLLEHGEGVPAKLRLALKSQELNAIGRFHAIWLLAQIEGPLANDTLFQIAGSDGDARVRRQAIRALADLTDPVLTQHRLDAPPVDAKTAARLAALVNGTDPRLTMEVVVALGRLRWSLSPHWLLIHLRDPDQFLSHAAQQAMRRSENWPAVLRLLDRPDSPIRDIARRSLADRGNQVVVDGLIKRLQSSKVPARRAEYADLLTRVHRLPGEWTYWGYRPSPRTPNSEAWEQTARIAAALDKALADKPIRLATLQRMRREEIPLELTTLADWLKTDHDSENVAAVLQAIEDRRAGDIRDALQRVILDADHVVDNRQTALHLFIAGLDSSSEAQLLQLAAGLEEGAVDAKVITELGNRPALASGNLLLNRVGSGNASVRSAAVSSLLRLKNDGLRAQIPKLLNDSDASVRRQAAKAAGLLTVTAGIESLRKLTNDANTGVRRESLDALRMLHDDSMTATAVAALETTETQLAALRYLRQFGGPRHLEPVSNVVQGNRSSDAILATASTLSTWLDNKSNSKSSAELYQTITKIQGNTGWLLRWRVAESADRSGPQLSLDGDGVLHLKTPAGQPGRALSIETDVFVEEPTTVQFLGASTSAFTVTLNEESVYERKKPGKFQVDSERFESTLRAGLNRIAVLVDLSAPESKLHLRFRKKSSKVEYERLIQAALSENGNLDRGAEVFRNIEKSLCLKCHRLGNEGGKIGPDLTGIGRRFSRIHIVESILEPSRNVAPSYGSLVVALDSGVIVTGVKVAETEQTLTLGDAEGKTREIVKSKIDERNEQPTSIMPEGIEKRISQREFIDLIAFLVSQKQTTAESSTP